MTPLPPRDYDRLLDLATTLLRSPDPRDAWPLIGQEMLGSLFHAHVFSFTEIDYVRSAGRVLGMLPEWTTYQIPVGSDMHDALIADHPLCEHYAVTGTLEPLKISSVVAPRAWMHRAARHKMRELVGTSHHLMLPLTVTGTTQRALSVLRTDTDFTEHDTVLARRLQPLLIGFDAHLRHLDRWHQATTDPAASHVPARTAAGLDITPRELTVLSLLAEGLTATAIARRLMISPRTVQKHKERLYRKLSAPNRLAAVLHAQHLGLIPATTTNRERRRQFRERRGPREVTAHQDCDGPSRSPSESMPHAINYP